MLYFGSLYFTFDSNRVLVNRDQYMDFDVLEFSLPIFCFAMDLLLWS